MSDKPTGVFVRLPLSNEQLGKLLAPTRPLNERLLAIGTPVAGGTFEIVGWVAPELFTHFGKIPTGTVISSVMTDSRTLPLVRQSDAQAQIAARDAEIVRLKLEVCHANDTADAAIGEVTRLREALVAARDAITSDLNAKSIVCTVWAGPAETLVDYIDAALKGGAA